MIITEDKQYERLFVPTNSKSKDFIQPILLENEEFSKIYRSTTPDCDIVFTNLRFIFIPIDKDASPSEHEYERDILILPYNYVEFVSYSIKAKGSLLYIQTQLKNGIVLTFSFEINISEDNDERSNVEKVLKSITKRIL